MDIQTQSSVAFIRKNWSRLAQGAAWIMAVVGLFMIKPPGLTVDDDRKIIPFTAFVVAALLGLIIPFLYRWTKYKYAWRWWAIGAVLLALSITGFFTYDHYLARWTVPCVYTRVVVGSQWTPAGRKAHQEYSSTQNMLEDFGCQADVLWNNQELDSRRRILSAVYIGCVAMSALSIITIVQAIFCMSIRGKSGRQKSDDQKPPKPKKQQLDL